MSTQSGITASEELLNDFKNIKSGVLVVKVSSDSTKLVADEKFPKTNSTDLSEAFTDIHSYASGIHPHPLYIIIPVSSDSNSMANYGFISFIPDVAPIREKMLYASTKNTLITQLGSNNFKKSHVFSWTELDELTYKNFNESSESEDDGPLTQEEKLLKQVDSLQGLSLAESSNRSNNNNAYKQQLATMNTPVSSSSGSALMFKIESNLESEFKSLSQKAGSKTLITFDIDLTSEKVNLKSATEGIKILELIKQLDSSTSKQAVRPQYGLYNYSTNKLAFIYSCPSGSKVKERMVYASNKQGLINHLKGLISDEELQIDKVLEVGDLDELDLQELESTSNSDSGSSTPNQESRNGLKFTKPKGPRRR